MSMFSPTEISGINLGHNTMDHMQEIKYGRKF